ncbi:hypothetical protein J4221_04715 [Candidatus Pacearchaeota archaeon]|nr:hypothetical protein [Candidatus Pacearchaeota archaeon]
MKRATMILVSILVLLLLVVLFYVISNSITSYTGFVLLDDPYRDCLENKDIKVFINSADSGEAIKKLKLLEYADSFDMYNCLINNEVCTFNNINSFPTFMINGKKIEGNIDKETLSKFSGCF